MTQAVATCFRLLRHWEDLARPRAWFSAGSSIEARIAMIAITTRSSISVNRVDLRRLIMYSMLDDFCMFLMVPFSRNLKFMVTEPQNNLTYCTLYEPTPLSLPT